MVGIETKDGFLDFSGTRFSCPNCGKQYDDIDDEYLERCNKNKSGTTKINCECGSPFYMTYNIRGDAVSFTYSS